MENMQDFKRFLNKVDKISELVQNLNSTDSKIQQEAMKEVDSYITSLEEPCREKVNKTTINTEPPMNMQNRSPENFMKIMEKDAEERGKKRSAKQIRATALKDKGNKAYAEEDFETAVSYYTEGLAELRDMQPLYTNRAQAYIKLGKYREAIGDCEWALKCNEKCTKAYLHMGKAYLALKSYNESRNCFEKIVEIEPGKENMIKEYLLQVELEEERNIQEKNALLRF